MRQRTGKFWKRLRRETSGHAILELALGMPLFLTAGLWGVETVHFAIINMKVSQVALHIADNVARAGDTSTLQDRKLYEEDIEDAFFGAYIQGGEVLDFFEHGRAIVSSLESFSTSDHCDAKGKCDPAGLTPGDQFIHWQRCLGLRVSNSSYGVTGDVLPQGIGPAGREVYAFDGNPAIFVQVIYDYQPLISDAFVGTPVIESIGAYAVRSDRDLSQLYKRKSDFKVGNTDCSKYQKPFKMPKIKNK